MTSPDDALRTDQGCQACRGCGDLTIQTYQGRPYCPGCYPERRAKYLEQQTMTWHANEGAQEAGA